MLSKIKRLLIGRPMKTTEIEEEKLSKFKALAVLSSDALSSVAYGTEQILIVLMAAGFAAIWYSIPISVAVLGLLTTGRRFLLTRWGEELISSPKTIWASPPG